MSKGYEIRTSAIHGQGMFARQDFTPGDVILAEAIEFQFSHRSLQGRPHVVGLRDVWTAFEKTPLAVQEAVLQLDDTCPDSTVDLIQATFEAYPPTEREQAARVAKIFANNSHTDSSACWLSLAVARINHSCAANAFYSLTEDHQIVILRAMQHISAREEILISYVTRAMPSHDKKTQLRPWGIFCQCPDCTLSTPEAQTRDMTRRRLSHLIRRVPDVGPLDVSIYERAVLLLEREPDFVDSVVSVRNAFANVYYEYNKMERGVECSRRIVDAATICYGADHPDTKAYRVDLERCQGFLGMGTGVAHPVSTVMLFPSSAF